MFVLLRSLKSLFRDSVSFVLSSRRIESLRPYLWNPVMPTADGHEVVLTQTSASIKVNAGLSGNTYQKSGNIKYFTA